ncbi:MAG: hypothetical protein WDN04_01665 [Rhodospirillales bacterium]
MPPPVRVRLVAPTMKSVFWFVELMLKTPPLAKVVAPAAAVPMVKVLWFDRFSVTK